MTVISVLLPHRVHGRDAALAFRDATESVLADLGEHDELITIDDGSDDEAKVVIAAAAARDSRVVVTGSGGSPETAAGIVRALGRGLEVARGGFIGRMDADDVSLPGRFAAERALLEADEGLGAVGVRVELFPAPAPGMERYIAWQNALVTREDHAREIFVESPLCHPSVLVRRSALDAVGGYREMPWAQDYDLWLRLDALGFGLAKVPRILFRWRIGSGSLTWTHPRNVAARFVEARAFFLAQRLRKRGGGLIVWGAGQTGRRLGRALEAYDLKASAFVDIDPRKVGRTARGAPIVGADEGVARARREGSILVVAVGAAGARDIVRARLEAAGLAEGHGFVCAA